MRLDHIAINVSNIANSASWYTENLGAEVIYADDTWAMLETGETKIALTLDGHHPPHVGFSVSDINDIPCDDPDYHRDGSAYRYVKDPDGNTIEFVYYPKRR
jgi:catechol 2,3-dioxygenase-like lactoylglutathione lyase family enzyme